MVKKILFILVLAAQFVAVANNVVSAENPWPNCYPCTDPPPPPPPPPGS